jgi:16S rRNA (cytosine1402-N4)-methyltransferase
MDRDSGLSAAAVVNTYGEEELARILFEYGEERFSRRIAAAIVRERQRGAIESTGRLARIIKDAIPAASRRDGPHPAKRSFQAIRIEVNDELGALRRGLEAGVDMLKSGGVIAVITFHSLEEKIVKQTFAELARGCICPKDFPVCVCGRKARVELIGRKGTAPSQRELEENPRARSARLRAARKL